MLRNVNFLRLFGNLFVLFIVAYMACMYYIFMYVNCFEVENKTIGMWAFIIIFHTFFTLLVCSFVQVILSDPGKVPLYWGFFLDDPDHKRRRYCLICHTFKPERCHHCSACNRCVLNMDHHCPWLNNCVGFYNRKFFLLLIFYVLLCKFIVAVYYFVDMIGVLFFLFEKQLDTPFFPHVMTLLAYILNCVLFVVLSFFYSFHVKLVISNMTTIEHMEKKRSNEPVTVNYDMGLYYNFVQIFGKNPYLWALPVFFKSGRPIGDGIVWPQKPSTAQVYDEPTNRATEQGVQMTQTRPVGPSANFEHVSPGGIGSNVTYAYPGHAGPSSIDAPTSMGSPTPHIQRNYNQNDPSFTTPQRVISKIDGQNVALQRPLADPVLPVATNAGGYNSFSNTMPLYEKFDHN